MTKKEIPNGSIRIKIKGLTPLKKTSKGYVAVSYDTKQLRSIINSYKINKKLDYVLDKNDKNFLRGYLKSDGNVGGDRVLYLPNGKQLNKAFSLFSPNLTFHSHSHHHHWDVIYQNPNGDYAYLYTKEKIEKFTRDKYKKVDEFDQVLPKLNRNLLNAMKKKEIMALSLYTLVKTYMRIGSEIYFKKNKHKGLVTLQKNNVVIKGNRVIFNFISKDGVPQKIDLVFPEIYIKNLTQRLRKVSDEAYVFCDDKNRKLNEKDFHDAFKKYCKKEFFPHIVRSHYATKTIENFLQNNRKPSKEEIKDIYNEIAERLGHKKFSKKKKEWEPSHTVTLAHYVSPKLVKRLKHIASKK